MRKYIHNCLLFVTALIICFPVTVSASNVQPGEEGFEEKLALVSNSAEQGDIDAQLALGRLYSKRQKGMRDYDAAFSWFKKAADQGSTEAMEQLAEMYLRGDAFPIDPVQAAYWVKKGSDAGSLDNTYNLAHYYLDGFGVTKDEAEGTRLLKYAAIKGNQHAINYFVSQAQKNNADAVEFLSFLSLEKN